MSPDDTSLEVWEWEGGFIDLRSDEPDEAPQPLPIDEGDIVLQP
jgi:hypothetical protein